MLLKKQTVWLLTMLSLVVVLSVYYMTSPEQKTNDLATVEQKAKKQLSANKTATKTDAKADDKVISSVADDSAFDELRLQLDDARSEQKEELTTELASTNLSPDERSKIKDQMDKLSETAQKEEILESLIKAMGYDDALVRADGEKVMVTVKAKKKLSATEANSIIQKVKKEIGDTNYVAVEFQPSK